MFSCLGNLLQTWFEKSQAAISKIEGDYPNKQYNLETLERLSVSLGLALSDLIRTAEQVPSLETSLCDTQVLLAAIAD